jgi:hypothetical protein
MGESAARGADKEVENKCFKRIQEFKKLQMWTAAMPSSLQLCTILKIFPRLPRAVF